ncbi:hypothetical protein THAOC_02386 [Thalassiosira oceanica]|uniref:WAP domain-containing protein n=1 Tax=Thalassiosira oceanica TaxID=159749 RepID=K0TAU3_THAOC|nr:hypothetical protein THAOC_02386 [Thalassiosira oceanica]|eukprot:EJK75883.1 hypothetical protein THAOC_02386 [Thalassiosira oceanica]
MHSRIVALAGAILAVSPSAAVDSEHRRVTRQRKDQLRRRRQTANVDKREVNDEDAAFWAQMMKLRELQGGSLPPTPVVTPFPVSSPTISTSAPTPIVSVGDFFPTVPPEPASTPTPTIIATIPFEPTVGPTGVLTPFPTGGETGEEPAFICQQPDFVGCTAVDPGNPVDECSEEGEPCDNGNAGEFQEYCCLDACPRLCLTEPPTSPDCTAKPGPPPDEGLLPRQAEIMLELPVDELSEEMSIAFTTKSMRTEEILKEKSGESDDSMIPSSPSLDSLCHALILKNALTILPIDRQTDRQTDRALIARFQI